MTHALSRETFNGVSRRKCGTVRTNKQHVYPQFVALAAAARFRACLPHEVRIEQTFMSILPLAAPAASKHFGFKAACPMLVASRSVQLEPAGSCVFIISCKPTYLSLSSQNPAATAPCSFSLYPMKASALERSPAHDECCNSCANKTSRNTVALRGASIPPSWRLLIVSFRTLVYTLISRLRGTCEGEVRR